MATMRELSREMMKIGIIDEMIEETMESVEPEELEEEAQVVNLWWKGLEDLNSAEAFHAAFRNIAEFFSGSLRSNITALLAFDFKKLVKFFLRHWLQGLG